jgi:hypothetical protein
MSKKTVALPKGFIAITGGGNSWQPKKPGEFIEGKLISVKTVHQEKKGKGKNAVPARDVPVYTIATKNGDVQVWESAGLRALAQVKKGKTVYIAFIAKKSIGGGKTFRDFAIGVK